MRVFRWLGRFTLVAGPVLVLLICVLTAFLMWVLVTAAGTRWALTTAVEALDGRIEVVEGSVWNGVRVGDLELDLPGVAVRLENVELRAEWRTLLDRQLQVRALRADTAWVDLSATPDAVDDDPGDEGFTSLDLPVSIRADDIALGELILTQDGKPLPVTLTDFSAALALGPERGQLHLRRLTAATESLNATLEGELNLEALHHPWPGALDLEATVNGVRPGSPVCFRHMLPTLPTADTPGERIISLLAGVGADDCPLQVHAKAQGSLDAVSVALNGSGQGMTLDAN